MKTIKPKSCKHCDKSFKPRNSMQKVCSTPCAIKHARTVEIKKATTNAKRALKSRRDTLKLNDKPYQLKLTGKVFNKMRRLQELEEFRLAGKEPTCISCGGKLGGDQWACGHFKSVGASKALQFDELNTYLQHNRRCNQNLSGDIAGTSTTHGYIQGLLNRFGEVGGQAIIDYCEKHHKDPNYTCEQLVRMRARFSAEIRRLEKADL